MNREAEGKGSNPDCGNQVPTVAERRAAARAREERLAAVERELKALSEESRRLTNEHIALRQSLERDFDPPQVRISNQNRFYRVRQQQDVLSSRRRALEEERRKLRPGWKNALEVVGEVIAAILALLFIFGGGAFLGGAIAFTP